MAIHSKANSMEKRILFLITLLFSFSACNKEKHFEGPDFYADDFESYDKYEDVLSDDDTRWNFQQITMDKNNISVDTSNEAGGDRCLKFLAAKSNGKDVSKCSLTKRNMAFWEGETMRISSKYFIEGNDKADWLFLQDIEDQTAIGAGPGIRLALVNNRLVMEHKFLVKDIYQEEGKEKDFPRNQWVELVWEIKLSQKKEGHVKVWQDGDLIINSDKEITLPKDFLYAIQGSKGMYSRVEIGITANSRDNEMTVYVDDFKVEILK